MVSLSRRRVLVGLGGAAVLLGAGVKHRTDDSDPASESGTAPDPDAEASGPISPGPAEVRSLPVGASDAYVTPPPATRVDVRDHGARLDGSHDDGGAIQSALDEAAKDGTPDTVYLPAGTAHVAEPVVLSSAHSGVTLAGDGSGTHLRLAGGFSRNHQLLAVDARRESDPVTDVTIRDLRIDGQGDAQNDPEGWGLLVWDSGNGDDNLLIENVWAHDFSGSNLQLMAPGTTVRFVSSWGAKHYHGIGIECSVNDPSRPVVVEYAHCRDNRIHGVDCSHGHTVVKHVLSEENGWGGKNTHEAYTGHWEDVVFRNNDEIGYMTNGPTDSLTMDRVTAVGNGKTGFYLQGGTDLRIGEMVAFENGADNSMGNIYINDEFTVTADSVRSGSALHGPGLNISAESTGTIRAYTHDGQNAEGGIENRSGVDVQSVVEEPVEPLPIPTNPEIVFR